MQTNFHDFFGFSDYLGLRAKLDFWTKNRQNEGSFGIALLEQTFTIFFSDFVHDLNVDFEARN